MSKYIDKDKVLEYIIFGVVGKDITCGELKRAIENLPTIEIVNCIECAYLGDDWWCYKHEFTPIPIEDYFCKDGERKDNE